MHDNVDPTIGIVGVAGKISSPVALRYRPTHTGTINREPSEVKPGAAVYCYQNDVSSNNGTAAPTSKILVQLTNGPMMQVAKVNLVLAVAVNVSRSQRRITASTQVVPVTDNYHAIQPSAVEQE